MIDPRTDRRWDLRPLAVALLVYFGCALGAGSGSLLRFPVVGTAILFPPYAVLTAVLLLAPAKDWWVYVLAAAAGDGLPHYGSEASVSFVLLAEVANSTRALVAAAGVRWLCGRRSPLYTLRDMAVFILFAALLGPLVGAFVGAADVVLHGRAGGFWLAWKAWLLSNALTGLTLLPLFLIARSAVERRRPTGRRMIEGALLLLGLCAVGSATLARADGSSLPASLYGPLPFLLWAAVRFGPAGAVSALSTITALAIGGALSGRGPFSVHAPPDGLVQLQFFVFAVSVPILLLAALAHQHARTEAELRQSRSYYCSVVEDQTELICRLLPDGTYTFVNGAYCRYFKRTPEDLLGKTFWMFIPPEGRRELEEFLGSLTPEHPVAMREHRVLAPGGEVRWQQWTDRGLFDAAGRLVEYQAVGRDVTERKLAEEEHRQLETQRQVEEALRETDRRKDEFLATLAHELRNPLAPIGLALEIMRHGPQPDDQTAWAQGVIARQTGHMTRLVDDLLDVSRITRGKVRLEEDSVNLASVVAQAVEICRPLLEERRHGLRLSMPDAPACVRGDAVRLSQVVANLLNNAAKYTEPGGRVEVEVELEGPSALLTVRDNGIGIPPSMLTTIFDLFIQGRDALDSAPGGLGIGLTLVKRLVELHGGAVEAHSEGLGTGSEFVVRLPLLPSAVPEKTLWPVEPAALDGAPLRVLVVDDNADATDSLARLLRLWGHTVVTAYDGLTALDQAQACELDAVLLDLGLPGLDGLAVARRLRQRYADQQLLLVAMTGFGQLQDRRRTEEAGFDLHLVKPVNAQQLRSLLSRHGAAIGHSRGT